MSKSKEQKVKHTLVRNGKTIFSSSRKIDAIFEHQKYRRSQKVMYKEVPVK